jgi:GNAT superfamily N-acetyltransferase
MENGLTIRRAQESDTPSVYALIVALGYPHLSKSEFEAIFKTVLSHSETIVLLAENETGQSIGLMTLSHRPQLRLAGTILCIDELVVADEARGLGVGHALLTQARQIAIKLNAKRIELHTNRARESYRRQFYVKNGFTEANSALMRLEIVDIDNE